MSSHSARIKIQSSGLKHGILISNPIYLMKIEQVIYLFSYKYSGSINLKKKKDITVL